MKLLVTFFLFLCSCLSGGYSHAHAVAHNGKAYYAPARNIEKKLQADSVTANKGCLLTNHTGLSKDDEDPTLIDDDDEEEVIRKQVAPARFLVTCSYAFLSSHHFIGLEDRLPCCTPPSYAVSCKYIVQRTLRI